MDQMGKTIANDKKFIESVRKILDKTNNVTKIESNGSEKYILDGFTGKSEITIYSNVGSEIYTIFTRFEDVEQSHKFYHCNPFSGKYNFHRSSMQKILGEFKTFVKSFEIK